MRDSSPNLSMSLKRSLGWALLLVLGGGGGASRRFPVTSGHFAGVIVRYLGGAILRGGVGIRWRCIVVALLGLGLAFGMATEAATQTCTTTDVAITGVTPAPSDPAALAGDCATLLDIMDTLRGTASLNWATTLSMASWDGVTLASDKNRVTNLQLIGRSLTGSIPDLSALTGLQSLWIQGNELTGSIPDLSALTGLRNLWLQNNGLTGSIPDLSALTNLESLHLHKNELTGSTPDLSALTNLARLLLSDNELTGSILDLIDQSGLSDREISRLATGNTDTVRNIRRGSTPRVPPLCRVLGFGLKMVPLDELGQEPDGPLLLRSDLSGPEGSGRKSTGIWSRSSAAPTKGSPSVTEQSWITEEKRPEHQGSATAADWLTHRICNGKLNFATKEPGHDLITSRDFLSFSFSSCPPCH